MKVYLNKALLFKEWKSAKWGMLILFLVELQQIVMNFSNNLNSMKVYLTQYKGDKYFAKNIIDSANQVICDMGNFVIIEILVVFLIFMVISMDRGKNYEILSVMPFNRREILKAKYFVSMESVIVPTVISYIIVTFMYFANITIIGPYVDYKLLLFGCILNLLVLILEVTILITVQYICGIGIVGAVLGAVVLALPSILISLIINFMQALEYNPLFKNAIEYRVTKYKAMFSFLGEWINPMGYNQSFQQYFPLTGGNVMQLDIRNFKMNMFYIRCSIIIFSIIIFYLLSYYAFNKNKLENTGTIFMFSSFNMPFKIGTSICFGILTCNIIFNNVFRNMVYMPKVIFMLSSLLIISILSYKITDKVIKMNKS